MRFDNAQTENLSPKFREAVEQSIANDKGLFIFGNTGVGKTYAMFALANGKGDVHNFVELLVEFRDHMQKGFYHSKLSELCQEKYLFIDDIGSEKTSEFVVEFLYLVVDKRYQNIKRTVLSTNLSLETFRGRYGDRILSRISEMCVLVELTGEDRRI